MAESIMTQYLRAAAVRYAWAMVGLPYRWGGDDPILGFDCSGLVIECLSAVGVLPHKYDATADVLFERWRDRPADRPRPGCLAFWMKDGKAVHVELVVDEFFTIGASGGGSSTTSEEAAAAANAFVKMRPIGYRGPAYVIIDPFKEVRP